MPQTADNKIGRRIAQSRKEAGYRSQKAFAVALGVSPGAVAQWESHRKSPRRTNVTEIAKLCGVTVEYLLGLSPTTTKLHPQMTMNEIGKVLSDSYRRNRQFCEAMGWGEELMWPLIASDMLTFFGLGKAG